MSELLGDVVQRILGEWAAERGWTEAPACLLERPADESHGDYATPVCMQLAKIVGERPRALAEQLRERLLADPEVAALVDAIEVAGPGFINFQLSAGAYAAVMREMLARGEAIGSGPRRDTPRVNLEFVSVNPNGPLHVGHGRYAAYGDSLKRLLEFSGTNVATEFYINDYGRQMDRFGRSIAARYAQSFDVELPVPADGYQGDYVAGIAAALRGQVGDQYLEALKLAVDSSANPIGGAGVPEIVVTAEAGAEAGVETEPENENGEDEEAAEELQEWPSEPSLDEAVAFFRAGGCAAMLEQMRAELEEYGVVFDCWFSETTLHTSGRLEEAVERLLASGEAFRQGDAVWLRTTTRGDDKDRVIIRNNGRPTYFAADIAYHESKLKRGFEHLIDIWGADHHGYVPRMKAAVEILAGRQGALEVIIGQMVNLLEKGELRKMSTRRGEMVTLTELVGAIGKDAARFFLVSRSQDQTLDLDLDLARSQSAENPVYYVQYAHARIAGILRNMPEGMPAGVPERQAVYASAYERALIKRLESFGDLVRDAAERRAPHRIAGYAQEVAADFHVFYKHCRVIGVEPAEASSRLALCLVTKLVIARCLDLLGVSAPESM
jgi:arginyl-tRNA synthetase